METVYMDWKQYEEITRHIYETLGKSAGVVVEGFGKDCWVKGKSGVEHQVDVLTKHSDGIHSYRTAIECKYWKDTVTKDTIMKVAAVVEDADLNKGVVVSKAGFSDDAVAFAKTKNIGLVVLREMQDEDWEGRPQVQFLQSKVIRPEITRIQIKLSLFNRTALTSEHVKENAMIVKKYDGTEIPMSKFADEFIRQLKDQPPGKIIRKNVLLPMSQLWNTDTNKMIYIDGFTMEGVLTERDLGLKFHVVDEVWLIMKSVFEDRSFTITKSGVIKEDLPGQKTGVRLIR